LGLRPRLDVAAPKILAETYIKHQKNGSMSEMVFSATIFLSFSSNILQTEIITACTLACTSSSAHVQATRLVANLRAISQLTVKNKYEMDEQFLD